jgi:hypothetical protein
MILLAGLLTVGVALPNSIPVNARGSMHGQLVRYRFAKIALA